MKPNQKYVFGKLLLLLVGLAPLMLLCGCGEVPGRQFPAGNEQQANAQAVAVTVAHVVGRPLQRTVAIVGSLHGYDEIMVTPKVEGRIQKIHHEVGDVVRPDDLLLEIEPTDYKLALQEARKGLELELAKLGLDSLPTGQPDLGKLPSVVRAQSVEENARRRLERAVRLRGSGLAQEEYDQAVADHRVAKAMRDQAVVDAQATLAAARHRQALLNTAEQRLRDTRVLAPAGMPVAPIVARSGDRATTSKDTDVARSPGRATTVGEKDKAPVEFVVAQRLVSTGEMVRAFPSTPVFRLVRDRPLKLLAMVPERYVGEVKVGQTVQVRVEAYPDQVFTGTIARINPTVDSNSRTFQIEAHLANQDRRLKAGSFVKAAILTRIEARAPTIPVEALVTFAGVNKVFVVHADKAQAMEIQTGVRGRGWVEVLGLLPLDSLVVTSGHSQLANGTPVRIRQAPGAASK